MRALPCRHRRCPRAASSRGSTGPASRGAHGPEQHQAGPATPAERPVRAVLAALRRRDSGCVATQRPRGLRVPPRGRRPCTARAHRGRRRPAGTVAQRLTGQSHGGDVGGDLHRHSDQPPWTPQLPTHPGGGPREVRAARRWTRGICVVAAADVAGRDRRLREPFHRAGNGLRHGAARHGGGPMTAQISLLATGGTISTRPHASGSVPAYGAEDLAASLGELRETTLLPRDVKKVPSHAVTAGDMWDLAAEVRAEIRAGADGVVVTHGTDTLEETA